MTIPPLTGGGLGIPSQRIPLLTAPVNTGIPPIVGDDKRLPLLPPQAGSGTAAAPGLRDDAPITLGGRLQQGDRLPDTTKLALALESATRALQHGRADVVLMELDAVWSNQLASDSPWYLRTAALQLLGRMSDAEQVIRDGIARLPRSAAILYLLGVHTANRGQVDAARVANDHALSLHPTEPLLWLQRAALTQMGGRHDTVAEILAHVQTLEPSFPASHWLVTLGRLGERAGRPTPAVQRAIERLTPSSVPIIGIKPRGTPQFTPTVPAGTSLLETAVRYGLTLLESPTQSARTATHAASGNAPRHGATTYADMITGASMLPPPRIVLPSTEVLVLAIGLIVMALVPPLRIPALMICGAAVMLVVSRRLG